MQFEELKTDRLILRKFTPDVYKYIFDNYADSQLLEFLSLKNENDLNVEKEKFRKGLSTFKTSFVNFKLLDLHSKAHIGNCGFHTWYIDHDRAEIGYDLLQDSFKGKGLMSEALNKIIPFGFNTMKLHRIEAFVGPNNTASLEIMRKYGFIQEGYLREHYCKNGILEDSLVFSLLKHDKIAKDLI